MDYLHKIRTSVPVTFLEIYSTMSLGFQYNIVQGREYESAITPLTRSHCCQVHGGFCHSSWFVE